MKTINDLWDEYYLKYNKKPKHSYAHFVTIISKFNFHRTYIRPQIKWWYNLK